jgi:hypothetical protein
MSLSSHKYSRTTLKKMMIFNMIPEKYVKTVKTCNKEKEI